MRFSAGENRRAGLLAAGAIAVLLAACDLLTGPPDEVSPFVVSDPVAGPAGTNGPLAFDASGSVPVTYISLAPGSVPGGASASLFNAATLAVATTALTDGGFDPVALAASQGDTIEILVWTEEGAQATSLKYEVPERRRPVVVRTSPPRGKRDVVLNSVVVIVFSEPMDGGTITAETIRLLRGGSPVAGTLELREDGLEAVFRPDAPLKANSGYVLEVSTGITDLDADPLDTALRVDFRTGATLASAASVTIEPSVLRTVFWEFGTVPFRAVPRDGAGNELHHAGTVHWRSSDPDIVAWTGGLGADGSYHGEVENRAQVQGGVGSATISATIGERTGTAIVEVEDVPWESVSVGANGYTCYLGVGGGAYCLGSNYDGQLGIGHEALDASAPVRVAGNLSFGAIGSGYDHTCGITLEGEAYCWGSNDYGKLGDGTRAPARSTPVLVSAGEIRFDEVGSGWSHTCALSYAGNAYCWGVYAWGHSDGSDLGPAPVAVPGGQSFTALAVGGAHACGLDAEGRGYCWGMNPDGRLGDGSMDTSYSPVPVAGDHRFTAITAGNVHTCALATTGAAYCWGGESAGTRETGTVTLPRQVALPEGVELVEVTAGQQLTCGLTADGAAHCWGWTWPCSSCDEVVIAPRRVGELAFKSLDAGEADLVCGITTGGAAHCWRARDLLP